MGGRRLWRVLGVGLLVALLAAVAAVLAAQAAQAWQQVLAPAPLRTDDAVVAVAATAGAAVGAWLALGAGASAVVVLRGSARRPALVPAVVHRAVALLLGVAVAAGPSVPTPGPSSPTPPPPAGPAPTSTHVASDLDPGWSAVRAATDAPATPSPTSAPAPAPTPTAAPTAPTAPLAPTTSARVEVDPGWRAPAPPPVPPPTVAVPADPLLLDGRRAVPDERTLVTVRRGDTLWDLAARHLGPQATDAEIAAEWPRWYAANREAVGDDPDLLLPGRQLQAPGDGGNRP